MPVSGTNAPNTFSTNVPLTLGTTTIDNGALNLTASLTNEASGAEWLVLHYSTVSGSPIASSVNGPWELQAFVPLSNPANGLGFYVDWSSNGTLLTPTESTIGNTTLGTNPITGSGTVFVNNTPCPYASCMYINTSNKTVDYFAATSDFAGGLGSNPASFLTANDFEIGVELQPVSVESIPEPGTIAIFGSALAGLGVVRLRRRAKSWLVPHQPAPSKCQ